MRQIDLQHGKKALYANIEGPDQLVYQLSDHGLPFRLMESFVTIDILECIDEMHWLIWAFVAHMWYITQKWVMGGGGGTICLETICMKC